MVVDWLSLCCYKKCSTGEACDPLAFISIYQCIKTIDVFMCIQVFKYYAKSGSVEEFTLINT